MPQPKNAGRQAREQAKHHDSVFAPRQLRLDDGTTIEVPPHPNLRMLDDERLADYEALMFETESYDRAPDVFIPEQTVKGADGHDITLPAETKQGVLLQPFRKDGKLITPPHSVQIVMVVLGEQDYKKLRAATIDGRRGSAADVWRIWNQQGLDLTERADADPKSDGGGDDLADVSPPDRE